MKWLSIFIAISIVSVGRADPMKFEFTGDTDPSLKHAGNAIFFSTPLAEGNYDVTVTLGTDDHDSTTTVKAEQRRLMLEAIHTASGKFETRTFTLNIRTP